MSPTLIRWLLLGSPVDGLNAAAVNVLALADGPNSTTVVTESLSAKTA